MLSRLLNAVEVEKREVSERIGSNDISIGQYLTEIAAKLIWIRRKINKVIFTSKIFAIISHFNLKLQDRACKKKRNLMHSLFLNGMNDCAIIMVLNVNIT